MHHYAVDEFRDWKYRDHLGLTLGSRPAASFAKRLMVTTVADGLGHAAMSVQGVGGDGQALERQQFEPRDRGMHLAALLRHGLGQAHEGVAAKDGHHQRRHMRAALGIDASEALAVDGDLAFRRIDARLRAESGHEAHEGIVEGDRIDCRQHAAEGVVAGRATLERDELARQIEPVPTAPSPCSASPRKVPPQVRRTKSAATGAARLSPAGPEPRRKHPETPCRPPII